jgi:hypothetical protein
MINIYSVAYSESYYEIADWERPVLAGEAHSRYRRTGMEHRQGSRYSTLLLVEIHWRGTQSALGFVSDVGNGGMYVASEASPGLHDCVRIALLEADYSWVWIPGLVVHRRKNGFGMMFRELDDGAQAAIGKLLDCGEP